MASQLIESTKSKLTCEICVINAYHFFGCHLDYLVYKMHDAVLNRRLIEMLLLVRRSIFIYLINQKNKIVSQNVTVKTFSFTFLIWQLWQVRLHRIRKWLQYFHNRILFKSFYYPSPLNIHMLFIFFPNKTIKKANYNCCRYEQKIRTEGLIIIFIYHNRRSYQRTEMLKMPSNSWWRPQIKCYTDLKNNLIPVRYDMIDILIIIAYTNITSDVIITNDIVNTYLYVHPTYNPFIFRGKH